jgi:GT2 family glycosyltransferase
MMDERGSPPGGPVVTVVVLNWNGRRLLPDCLDAVAKQDLDRALWETWVVDNASEDDSLELLASDYPWARVVRNDANLGFAAGNNTALRTATTPYVVLLNNDAHPEPDWLRRLLAVVDGEGEGEDDGGRDRVAAVTSKVLFAPRFLAVEIETPALSTPTDPRELGMLVTQVGLDGAEVTEEVLWDRGAYGPEESGGTRFRWTRPQGTVLVPVGAGPERSGAGQDLRLTVRARADRTKPLTLRWPGGSATVELSEDDGHHELVVPGSAPLVDVVNNVGSVFHAPGYGADRGYQEVDEGQYDTAEDVPMLCGAAVLLRTAALEQVGVFDDDFFMYYEDTDLSWRLRAAGWNVRYEPTAVVRHLHSASSVEWSPFFTFHVERNRLLTLTKDAPAGLATGQLLRFQVTTLSMARRALLQALRERRRPALRPLLLRLRVTGSYLRLLPRMLWRRRSISRSATTSRSALFARWMAPEQ